MDNADDIESFDYRKWILHRVKFFTLLTLQIPALFLSLLIFYFYLKNPTILQTSQNRSLFILFVVNFIQVIGLVTLSIRFHAVGSVSPGQPIYCTLWTFFAYTLYAISEYLMATISIQQHMLVFSSHVLRIRWKRIVFHYLPLIFFIFYPIIWYTIIILLYPCDGTQWDYTSTVCGFASCYLLNDKILGTIDWLLNVASPMVIIVFANALLIIRVIRQKRRQQRRFRWKQQRRMTIQLFCISSIYMIGWVPNIIVGLVQILGYPTFLIEIQTNYLIELVNLICLLLPWMCVGLIPELLKWIKTICHIVPARNTVGTLTHPPQ